MGLWVPGIRHNLAIDTGKCLDVEALTKVCLGCQRIAKEDDTSKKADLPERHTLEGIKRIFFRNQTTRQLQYIGYFGNGYL